MTSKKKISEEQLLKKIRNIDASSIYEIKKTSDKILYVLEIIKTDLKIDSFIPISALSTIFVDVLGISVTPRVITNALNPIKTKIHRQDLEGEISCKIMRDGISHISKIIQKPTTSKKIRSEKILSSAIHTITQMGINKEMNPGLYYIVIVDLAHSTEASTKLDPTENTNRIKEFIEITQNALPKKPKNFAKFVKANGDGALFFFYNFEDILQWARNIDRLCNGYNQKCIDEKKQDEYQMFSKKIVHLGEVQFDDVYNPISLAVNQIFKIEKEFGRVNLGITEAVFQVIIPRIESGQLSHKLIKKVTLDGEKNPKPIWEIGYN